VGNEFVDYSYRSFETQNAVNIIQNLREDYTVLLMSQNSLPLKIDDENPIAVPQTENLRLWAAVIKMSDHFLGCDSLGQHLARSVGTKSTVVIGSTYPVNVSYIDDDMVKIFDVGKNSRSYMPIRIIEGAEYNRKNETCMVISKKTEENIISSVRENLGEPIKIKKLIPNKKVA
jgi:ADP-heptose:LPS heptosyltransferase